MVEEIQHGVSFFPICMWTFKQTLGGMRGVTARSLLTD